ncbi:MAG: phosphoribosylaminoimidazolesuccinocarboxamide synthase [Desulfobacterota bacterium]|nr:phosphoribosylaminoimidazolesuccinocarboxamide synthase [Thermodesulfobacteriota bacterium]MDW8002678.1 phosphoribosylaminoimidazolesuccinocarboxamide synthase [Deltaproteobacteria bacterium]
MSFNSAKKEKSKGGSVLVSKTDFPDIPLKTRGKVRDIYDFGDRLLIVATDRISAFDVVMPNPVPDKGKVLTQLSRFWFDFVKDIVPNHMISVDVEDFPDVCKKYRDVLEGRSMLVFKAKPIPVECIVRGYISGSAWEEYKKKKEVCGIKLPDGLVESSKLDEPIFTPTTKAEVGHDENLTFDEVRRMVGDELAKKIRDISIEVYKKAREYAEKRGIIIADTKMEFGLKDGELILIDELLTPDSSRFWPMDEYKPGGPQKSFDKQFLRDYLTSIGWNKTPPAPWLPDEIVEKTRIRYLEAYERLVGKKLV